MFLHSTRHLLKEEERVGMRAYVWGHWRFLLKVCECEFWYTHIHTIWKPQHWHSFAPNACVWVRAWGNSVKSVRVWVLFARTLKRKISPGAQHVWSHARPLKFVPALTHARTQVKVQWPVIPLIHECVNSHSHTFNWIPPCSRTYTHFVRMSASVGGFELLRVCVCVCVQQTHTFSPNPPSPHSYTRIPLSPHPLKGS